MAHLPMPTPQRLTADERAVLATPHGRSVAFLGRDEELCWKVSTPRTSWAEVAPVGTLDEVEVMLGCVPEDLADWSVAGPYVWPNGAAVALLEPVSEAVLEEIREEMDSSI